MKTNGHWFVSVGELSGDLLAADLVRSLKRAFPDLRFSGITGPSLVSEGVSSLAHMNELNVMGLTEVAKKIASINMLKQNVLEHLDRQNIRVAILVDFSGFHLKLAEELKLRGIYVIQYVAPKLWAWGESRVSALKKYVDLLLAAFPFEEAYFQKFGVNCRYVGCPILKRTSIVSAKKEDFGVDSQSTLFAFLPGSRYQEISRLWKPMLSIVDRVRERLPQSVFMFPIATSLRKDPRIAHLLSSAHEGIRVVEEDSLRVMAAADAALVASGTATLECALLKTPLAVIYSMNPLTFYLANKKVKVKWASLVNILRNKELVREFLQHFDESEIADELCSLVLNREKRARMLDEFEQLEQSLKTPEGFDIASFIANSIELAPHGWT